MTEVSKRIKNSLMMESFKNSRGTAIIQSIKNPREKLDFGIVFKNPDDQVNFYKQHVYCLYLLLFAHGQEDHRIRILAEISSLKQSINKRIEPHCYMCLSKQLRRGCQQNKKINSKLQTLTFLEKQLTMPKDKLQFHTDKQKQQIKKGLIIIFQQKYKINRLPSLNYFTLCKLAAQILQIYCEIRDYYNMQVVQFKCKKFEQKNNLVFIEINKKNHTCSYITKKQNEHHLALSRLQNDIINFGNESIYHSKMSIDMHNSTFYELVHLVSQSEDGGSQHQCNSLHSIQRSLQGVPISSPQYLTSQQQYQLQQQEDLYQSKKIQTQKQNSKQPGKIQKKLNGRLQKIDVSKKDQNLQNIQQNENTKFNQNNKDTKHQFQGYLSRKPQQQQIQNLINLKQNNINFLRQNEFIPKNSSEKVEQQFGIKRQITNENQAHWQQQNNRQQTQKLNNGQCAQNKIYQQDNQSIDAKPFDIQKHDKQNKILQMIKKKHKIRKAQTQKQQFNRGFYFLQKNQDEDINEVTPDIFRTNDNFRHKQKKDKNKDNKQRKKQFQQKFKQKKFEISTSITQADNTKASFQKLTSGYSVQEIRQIDEKNLEPRPTGSQTSQTSNECRKFLQKVYSKALNIINRLDQIQKNNLFQQQQMKSSIRNSRNATQNQISLRIHL